MDTLYRCFGERLSVCLFFPFLEVWHAGSGDVPLEGQQTYTHCDTAETARSQICDYPALVHHKFGVSYEKGAVTAFIQAEFESEKQRRVLLIDALRRTLHFAFQFVDDAFGGGQEMTLFLTELTNCSSVMEYIAMHGCPEYLE